MFKLLSNTSIDFQSQRHFWMTFSGIAILAGFVGIIFRGGLNLSIDFAGGVAMTLRSTAISGQGLLGEGAVRTALENVGIQDAEVKSSRSADSEDLLIHFKQDERIRTPELLIRTLLDSLYSGQWSPVADNQLGVDATSSLTDISFLAVRTTLTQEQLTSIVNSANVDGPRVIASKTETGEDVWILAGKGRDAVSRLRTNLSQENPNYQFEVRSIEVVGPRIGSELRTKALLAVFASWLLIILYLWWRFDLVFGIAAVIALIHDVLITFGIMGILNFEFSMTVVGAFLTIIGFSVNDTIVTFDRIRENLKRHHLMDLKQLINLSINQTLSRTIITNGTVFVVVTVLLIFGGDVLRPFSFAMFVGSIVGTYSSIYIASPILIDYVEKSGRPLAKKMKNK